MCSPRLVGFLTEIAVELFCPGAVLVSSSAKTLCSLHPYANRRRRFDWVRLCKLTVYLVRLTLRACENPHSFVPFQIGRIDRGSVPEISSVRMTMLFRITHIYRNSSGLFHRLIIGSKAEGSRWSLDIMRALRLFTHPQKCLSMMGSKIRPILLLQCML